MKRIFLGGRTDSKSAPCPMGSIYDNSTKNKESNNHDTSNTGYGSDDSEVYDYDNNSDFRSIGGEAGADDEMRFIEVWDYVGGTSFRGFITDKEQLRNRIEKTLFLFFEHVAGTQLKPGYVCPYKRLLYKRLTALTDSWLLSSWQPNALPVIALSSALSGTQKGFVSLIYLTHTSQC
jgi:hypothetical protein